MSHKTGTESTQLLYWLGRGVRTTYR